MHQEKEKPTKQASQPDDEWKIDIERMPKVVKMPSLGEQRIHEDLEKLNKILE